MITHLEVLPIRAIRSTLELNNSFGGEFELSSIEDFPGSLVALDILAFVVEGEGGGFLGSQPQSE